MSFKSKVLLTGINLLKESGGTPKTMSLFQQALDAQCVSFTDSKAFQKSSSAFPNITHVKCKTPLIGRQYNYASKKSREPADILARHSDLLTCHAMLRYHANWVHSVSKLYNKPYWFIPHGQLDPFVYSYRSFTKKIWYFVFGKQFLRDASQIIFATERERQKSHWLYRGNNSCVVHWPVQLLDLSLKEKFKEEIRSKYYVSSRGKIFLFLGRLDSMKRPLETIKQFLRFSNEEDKLLVVGPDYDITAADCRTAAESNGGASKVIITGPLYGEEKLATLLGSDCYISLSARENFNHTAAESLSAGLPVILSPGNDLSDDLRPYDCGWFMKSDSQSDFADTIKSFHCSTPEVLHVMGERGRKFIQEKCSFDHFKDRLRLIAEQTISSRKQ